MNRRGWMICSLAWLLSGCASMAEKEAKLGDHSVVETVSGSLVAASSEEENPVELFEEFQAWLVNETQLVESYVFKDWETFTYQATAFYETRVQDSSVTGILVQAPPYVLTFQPQSPFFTIWKQETSFTLSEVLLEMSDWVGFNPSTFETSFIQGLNEQLLQSNFKKIDRGWVDLTGVSIQLASLSPAADLSMLESTLMDSLFEREVAVSTLDETLQVAIQLKDIDQEDEEFTRVLASAALTTLKSQPESLLMFEVFALEIRNALGELVGTVDLSVGELFTLPWKGQLSQTLAERVPYFRYYGAIEFE